MKGRLLFISCLLSLNSLFTQDIISNPILTNGIATLGNSGQVNLNINQRTVCDNYTINSTVDHVGRIITIEILYNYFSNCDASFAQFFESIQMTPLLTGIYSVQINLTVPSDLASNEFISLTSLSVVDPVNQSCDGFVPPLPEPCPTIFNQVCACNGQNYTNECEAYLQDQNGFYNYFSCGKYLINNSIIFDCLDYFMSKENTFEKYGCGNLSYPGKEIYLQYEHQSREDTIDILFRADPTVSLFLTSMTGDESIECIAKNINQRLFVTDLAPGTYYLIADSQNSSSNSISFCPVSSVRKELSENAKQFNIYPNPNSGELFFNINTNDDHFYVNLKVFKLSGEEVGTFNQINLNRSLVHQLDQGIYFVEIDLGYSKLVRKLIVH